MLNLNSRANKSTYENYETNANLSLDLIDKIKHDSLRHSSKFQHLRQIFYSQFYKKFKFLARNRFLLIAHFILPALILIIGILSGIVVVHNLTNSPPLAINLKPYRQVYSTVFVDNNSASNEIAQIYNDLLSDIPNVILNSK